MIGPGSDKNRPVPLVKGYKTENPQQLNLTKKCGQAKSFASTKYVNYPIAMDWCQLQLFRALIEIQMYKCINQMVLEWALQTKKQ